MWGDMSLWDLFGLVIMAVGMGHGAAGVVLCISSPDGEHQIDVAAATMITGGALIVIGSVILLVS
jgi:hypothetical protein